MLSNKSKPRVPTIACPHCGTRAIVRDSQQMTLLVRELRFHCENDACGHTFVGQLVITRTVRPSACPNPDVYLPMAPRRSMPTPANDDGPLAERKLMSSTG